MADCKQKGRTANGERNGRSKLKESDVLEIKRRLAGNETHEFIAKCFGVERSLITMIGKGKRWSHVDI
jgi:hypothetical protein